MCKREKSEYTQKTARCPNNIANEFRQGYIDSDSIPEKTKHTNIVNNREKG